MAAVGDNMEEDTTPGTELVLSTATVQPKNPISERKRRVIVAATGSTAAIKFPTLCWCFLDWFEVKAVATKSSLHFFNKTVIPSGVPLFTDDGEWSSWKKIGDKVAHIELSSWADVMVIAPISANTLAKVLAGLCDNLLTSIVRAWDYAKPLYAAPSMHPSMWTNPFTSRQIDEAARLGMRMIPVMKKQRSNGDIVSGTMWEPIDIYRRVMLDFLAVRPRCEEKGQQAATLTSIVPAEVGRSFRPTTVQRKGPTSGDAVSGTMSESIAPEPIDLNVLLGEVGRSICCTTMQRKGLASGDTVSGTQSKPIDLNLPGEVGQSVSPTTVQRKRGVSGDTMLEPIDRHLLLGEVGRSAHLTTATKKRQARGDTISRAMSESIALEPIDVHLPSEVGQSVRPTTVQRNSPASDDTITDPLSEPIAAEPIDSHLPGEVGQSICQRKGPASGDCVSGAMPEPITVEPMDWHL